MRSRLSEIFDQFDSKNEGKISAEDVDLENISPHIILIFKPLLIEMETYNECLDREEFIESSLALMGTLSIQQRNQILNVAKKPNLAEEPKFRPKISNNSRRITNTVHRSLDAMRRFEVIQGKLQTKMQGLQEKYKKEELDKCTFTPNIAVSKLVPRKGSVAYGGFLTSRSAQRDRIGSLRSARARPYRE